MLEGVGRKVFLAPGGGGGHTKVQPPNDRHLVRKVDESTVKKDQNSVLSSSVDVSADVAAIRGGQGAGRQGAWRRDLLYREWPHVWRSRQRNVVSDQRGRHLPARSRCVPGAG